MHWVPLIVWIAAAVVAVVVLGYCAYELVWKTKRLRRDLAQLQALNTQLASVQQTLTAAQGRLTAATRSSAAR